MRIQTLTLTLVALLLVTTVGPGAAAEPPTRVLLPFVTTGSAQATLGLELTPQGDPAWVTRAAAVAPGWLRLGALAWRDVEPAPDAGYSWDAPATRALEAQLERAAALGLSVVLVLHGNPDWAVEPFSTNCAPINSRHHERFARFAAAAVARYSAPPFRVSHYEIGNEPDASLFGVDSPYGCWGRQEDPHYGGQEYGRLLNAVYPAMKAASPYAQVLNGGLLLDKAFNPLTGAGLSGRFLEGMLEVGAGGSFDILAFHSYSFYDGTPDGNAGAQDWKPAYLRGLLARYGLHQKPLFNTEGALLCAQATPECALAQAHAIPRLYVRALRDELVGQIWYLFDSDSFRNTGLVDPGNPAVTRPAYRAFAYATRALAGMRYAGLAGGLPPGAEGYSLTSGGRTTLVLWSDAPQLVTLPVGAGERASCASWEGASLACAPSGGALSIDLGPGPVYVTLARP